MFEKSYSFCTLPITFCVKRGNILVSNTVQNSNCILFNYLFFCFSVVIMSKKDQTYFSSDWLADPEFNQWLVSVSNNTQARCKLCRTTFNLSNMGRQALTSHASGQKHSKVVKSVSCFFQTNKFKDLWNPQKRFLSHHLLTTKFNQPLPTYSQMQRR